MVNGVLDPGIYTVLFTEKELKGIDINNISIQSIIKKDGVHIYNKTSPITTFGEYGHIDIKSVAPEQNEMGTRYKWNLVNPTNDKTNVKLTTIDNKEELFSVDLNPGEVISAYTTCEKGEQIQVHTRQLDNTYIAKDAKVDKCIYKFKEVEVKNIAGDSSTNGNVIRWRVKNPNINAKANVIIRDNIGGVIMQFDLDIQNEKVFDIDINRGRSIVVEARMANGKYEGKNYIVTPIENKTDNLIHLLDTIDTNGIITSKIEVENIMNGKANVIINTRDDINQLFSFDLNIGEKKLLT